MFPPLDCLATFFFRLSVLYAKKTPVTLWPQQTVRMFRPHSTCSSKRVTSVFVWQPLVLVLLDLEALMPILRGVVMELGDCSLPLLKGADLRTYLIITSFRAVVMN